MITINPQSRGTKLRDLIPADAKADYDALMALCDEFVAKSGIPLVIGRNVDFDAWIEYYKGLACSELEATAKQVYAVILARAEKL